MGVRMKRERTEAAISRATSVEAESRPRDFGYFAIF